MRFSLVSKLFAMMMLVLFLFVTWVHFYFYFIWILLEHVLLNMSYYWTFAVFHRPLPIIMMKTISMTMMIRLAPHPVDCRCLVDRELFSSVADVFDSVKNKLAINCRKRDSRHLICSNFHCFYYTQT